MLAHRHEKLGCEPGSLALESISFTTTVPLKVGSARAHGSSSPTHSLHRSIHPKLLLSICLWQKMVRSCMHSSNGELTECLLCARHWGYSGEQEVPSQPSRSMRPTERRNGFPEHKGHKSFTRAQCSLSSNFLRAPEDTTLCAPASVQCPCSLAIAFLPCCYLLKSCLSVKIPSYVKTRDMLPELNQQKSESSPPSSECGHSHHRRVLEAG